MYKKLLTDDFFGTNEYLNSFFCVETKKKDLHSHEFWKLSYVYEGGGMHYTQEHGSPINAHEFVFVSPGAVHDMVSPQENKDFWIHVCNILIHPEYFKKIIKKYRTLTDIDQFPLESILNKPFCIKLRDTENLVYNTVISIAHDRKYSDILTMDFIDNALLNLLIYITRLYSPLDTPQVKQKDEVLDELIRYMKANYGAPMDLEYLAAYTHYSREYLSRRFKQYTGDTISHFLTGIRIEHAKLMLHSSTHSVGDIAAYCGYMSLNNFQRAFKSLVHMSPSEYRKSNKEY